MKEIGPIAGIDHIAGIDCKSTIEMTTEKKIIDLEIIMKEIDPIAETDHIVEKDQEITTKEIDHNISTEITKEIGHTVEIGHIVEIGHEATTTKLTIEMSIEMTIRRKIIEISKMRDMREGLEITMKTHMKTSMARIKKGINIETDTEMTVMTRLNIGLRRKITCVMMLCKAIAVPVSFSFMSRV